jgi:hypothetical protein
MSKVEKLKSKRDKLKVELGVLENVKSKLDPILKRHKCKTPGDIKKAAKKIKSQIAVLEGTLKDLGRMADAVLEKLEEATSDE